MIIKIDDSILNFPNENLHHILLSTLDIVKYTKDSVFLSINLIINAKKRLKNKKEYQHIVNKLNAIETKYSTIMSMNYQVSQNLLIFKNHNNQFISELIIESKIKHTSNIVIEEILTIISKKQFYFEDQNDGEFLKNVIKQKYPPNHNFESYTIQTGGGNNIVQKYKQSISDNMLWMFLVDNDICIDGIRIKDSIMSKMMKIKNQSFTFYFSTISRSIENLIPNEIIYKYIEEFSSRRKKVLFDKLINNEDIYYGYHLKEGINKDIKNGVRKNLKNRWKVYIQSTCESFNEECYYNEFCNKKCLDDIIFSGIKVGGNDIVKFAIEQIKIDPNFEMSEKLKKICNLIYELSISNNELSNLMYAT